MLLAGRPPIYNNSIGAKQLLKCTMHQLQQYNSGQLSTNHKANKEKHSKKACKTNLPSRPVISAWAGKDKDVKSTASDTHETANIQMRNL